MAAHTQLKRRHSVPDLPVLNADGLPLSDELGLMRLASSDSRQQDLLAAHSKRHCIERVDVRSRRNSCPAVTIFNDLLALGELRSAVHCYTLPRLASHGNARRSRSGSRVGRAPFSSHSPNARARSRSRGGDIAGCHRLAPPPPMPTQWWLESGPDHTVALTPQHMGFGYLIGMRIGAADTRAIDRHGNFETGVAGKHSGARGRAM